MGQIFSSPKTGLSPFSIFCVSGNLTDEVELIMGGRFPRVFGDKFGEEFCDKFCDEFSKSPNLVMN